MCQDKDSNRTQTDIVSMGGSSAATFVFWKEIYEEHQTLSSISIPYNSIICNEGFTSGPLSQQISHVQSSIVVGGNSQVRTHMAWGRRRLRGTQVGIVAVAPPATLSPPVAQTSSDGILAIPIRNM